MKNYIVGEDRIAASSPEDLVGKMHKASRAQAEDDRTWMLQVADRMKLQSGATVRTDTAAHFVADLIAVGHISEGE